MLGILAHPVQVGYYSASYRVINQVLAAYYLVTQAIYPQLARHALDRSRQKMGVKLVLGLAAAGTLLAFGIVSIRGIALTILFGHQFLAAAPLLMVLAWAIPLDFIVSWFNNAYIAWGLERQVLLCTAIAAGSNILLNLFSIPRYGAMAAAVNTLICYGIYLACIAALRLRGRRAELLQNPVEQ